MSTFHRYVAAPLLEGRALRSLAFLVIGIPLGVAWFVLLVTGWSLGLGLLITLLGIPVLLVLGVAVRGAAALERRLADGLLGTRLAGSAPAGLDRRPAPEPLVLADATRRRGASRPTCCCGSSSGCRSASSPSP